MDISLILPTYNEAENIPLLVELIFKNFEEANLEGGVVIMDDNSPDETWKKAEALKKSYARLELIRRLSERGLSSAVLEGF